MELVNIHSDKRGYINLLKGAELSSLEEVTIFKTKKGKARGGCIHRQSCEYVVVIEGTIKYSLFYLDVEYNYTLSKGDNLFIPSSTPHYFVSLTDSVVLEWGAREEEKKEKHTPTREIVDRINNS